MSKLNLVLVAVVSLATGWLVGTLMPWWVTAIMIGGAVAYVVSRTRSA